MVNLPIIIYNTADGKANVTLFARDGSMWMNQNQLAELFDTSVPNISMHISSILNDNELRADSVIKYYLITAADGKQYEVASPHFPRHKSAANPEDLRLQQRLQTKARKKNACHSPAQKTKSNGKVKCHGSVLAQV